MQVALFLCKCFLFYLHVIRGCLHKPFVFSYYVDMRFFKTFLPAIVLIAAAFCPAFAQSTSRPVVDMISATPVSTNKIKVTWKIPRDFNAQSILIYKDTAPITSSTIKHLAPEAQLSARTASYIDTVATYKEYFYAVLARMPDGTIYSIVLPSINATVKGAAVEKPANDKMLSEEQLENAEPKVYAEGSIRELPLPYLDIIEDFDRKPSNLKPEVMEAGKELAAGYTAPPKEKLEPHYFDEDLVSPPGGNDFYLFEILRDYFVKRNYKDSVPALQKFLSVNRSENTTNRAVFYLAQSHYYLGNYRHALTMFLFVEDAYPVLSKKWINSTLDFYTIPKN